MANNEDYRRLSESPLSANLDPHTLAMLFFATEDGKDVDDSYMPMLVRVKVSADITFPEGVKVYSRIGTIVALSATPGQLLNLLENKDILSYEASRSVGVL